MSPGGTERTWDLSREMGKAGGEREETGKNSPSDAVWSVQRSCGGGGRTEAGWRGCGGVDRWSKAASGSEAPSRPRTRRARCARCAAQRWRPARQIARRPITSSAVRNAARNGRCGEVAGVSLRPQDLSSETDGQRRFHAVQALRDRLARTEMCVERPSGSASRRWAAPGRRTLRGPSPPAKLTRSPLPSPLAFSLCTAKAWDRPFHAGATAIFFCRAEQARA